jgi:hypothetical protein
MGRPKGTKRITLHNDIEEWHKFCTKENALAYVERGWCSVEDVAEQQEDISLQQNTSSETQKQQKVHRDRVINMM